MRLLWTEIKCIISAARLFNKDSVNKKGLDLSKEVLWVSKGQRIAVLRAIKVGDPKKICQLPRFEPALPTLGWLAEYFFLPPTLTAHKTAALWPTQTHSTSLERSWSCCYIISAQKTGTILKIGSTLSK